MSKQKTKPGMQFWSDQAPKPSLTFSVARRAGDDYYRVLPFTRQPAAIVVVAVLLVVFSIPLFSVSEMMGGGGDDLFSIVSMAFMGFWVLGWLVGIACIALVLLILLLGRETVRLRQGELILQVGLPFAAIGAGFPIRQISNLRAVAAEPNSPKFWRGTHLVFDFDGHEVALGSGLHGARAAALIDDLLPRLEQQAKLGPPAASDAENPPRTALIDDRVAGTAGLGSVSTRALIVANLVPLFGALFLNWQTGEIMLLFWAESAIIGFFNLAKMIKVGGLAALFLGLFFVGHYGGFMAGHLLFIYAFFGSEFGAQMDRSSAELAADFMILAPALLGFFISHGVSFLTNFVGRGEYRVTTMQQLMSAPYQRIIVMHLTIIFGGFMTMALGSSLPALALLILAKTAADVRGHLHEHKGKAAASAAPSNS